MTLPRSSQARPAAAFALSLLTMFTGAVLAPASALAATPRPPKVVTHVEQVVTATTTTASPAPPGTGSLMGRDGVPALAPATGFARGTTGGGAGPVYHVTSSQDSLTDPAPGTLRYGLRLGGPRWIVFDSGMTITFRGPMPVPSDTTIDGRGRHVVLTGHGVAGLHLYDVSNVIIEGLTLHDFGDVARTIDNDPSDAIDVQRSSRVWIDHNTLSHTGDKLISVEDGGRGVTLSWNHFADQQQVVQIGAQSTAAHDVGTTVTVHHNYFDRVGYRLPLVLYAKAHVYNNYVHAWRVSAVRSERIAQVYLERNVFAATVNRKAALLEPAQVCNDTGTFCDPRSGFLADVGNYVTGHAVIRSTDPRTVFDPSRAYDYTAEAATPSLASRIVAHAGAPGVPAAARPLPVARVLTSRYGVRWSASARARYYVVRVATHGHRTARTYRTTRRALAVHRVTRVTVYALNSAGASRGRTARR